MSFDFAAAIRARPAGATRAQLVAAYGDPLADGYTRTGKGWFNASPTFARNLVRVPISDLPGFPLLYGTTRITGVTVHRLVAPILVASWAEVYKRGLHNRLHTFDGATASRHMLNNYANPLSVHAYGAALDFDQATNGYGIPAARMQINRDFVELMERMGWTWGGRWTNTDGMHLQWTDPLPGTAVPAWQDAGLDVKTQIIKPEFKPIVVAPTPVAQPASVKVLMLDQGNKWQAMTGSQATYNGTTVQVRGSEVWMSRAPRGVK